MSWYTVAWILWILAFVVIEGIALADSRRNDTLSEHVWTWFSLKGEKGSLRWWQAILRFGFMAFMAWLTIHFLTGGAWL